MSNTIENYGVKGIKTLEGIEELRKNNVIRGKNICQKKLFYQYYAT